MNTPQNAPPRPAFLTGEGKKEWNRIVAELDRLGRLESTDLALLATYCVTFARWIEAERMVKREGAVAVAPSGYAVKSAWLTVADKAQDQLQKQIVQLGLSPYSRGRVSSAPPADDAADFFARR